MSRTKSKIKITYADGRVEIVSPAMIRGKPPGARKRGARRQSYADYINSAAWKRLRARVIARDAGRCVRCRSAVGLHVHHKTYARFRCERLEDLETLCADCHAVEHDVLPRGRDVVEFARRGVL